jgi:hypothetical protein
MRREVEQAATAPRKSAVALETLMARVCKSLGIAQAALVAGGRTARVSRAREGIAYLWLTVLGHAGRPLAAPLGVRPQNVYRAAAQGAAACRHLATDPVNVLNMATSPLTAPWIPFDSPRNQAQSTGYAIIA